MSYSTILTIIATNAKAAPLGGEMHRFVLTDEVSSQREAVREAMRAWTGLSEVEGDIKHGVSVDLIDLDVAVLDRSLGTVNGVEVPKMAFDGLRGARDAMDALHGRGLALQGFVSVE